MRWREPDRYAAALGQPLYVPVGELTLSRNLRGPFLPEVIQDSSEQHRLHGDGGTLRDLVHHRELQVREGRDEIEVPVGLFHGEIPIRIQPSCARALFFSSPTVGAAASTAPTCLRVHEAEGTRSRKPVTAAILSPSRRTTSVPLITASLPLGPRPQENRVMSP